MVVNNLWAYFESDVIQTALAQSSECRLSPKILKVSSVSI